MNLCFDALTHIHKRKQMPYLHAYLARFLKSMLFHIENWEVV